MQQIIAITVNNLKAIPHRWGSAIVVVIGVAGVVAVLASVMSMSVGLTHAVSKQARDDWAIVLRKGAFAEAVSALPLDALVAIESLPHVARNEDGSLAMQSHFVTAITLPRKAPEGVSASVLVRGVYRNTLAAQPDFKLVQGRLVEPGKRELLAGVLASDQYQGLQIGAELINKGINWRIVGLFSADGAALESELVGDLTTVMAGMQRSSYSSVRLRLLPETEIDAFNVALEQDPRLKAEAKWEKDYYQSDISSQLIEFVAFVVSGIMALGATFGALNVMYAAVSGRTREIATLRALGFGPVPVAISILVEALCLALLGGLAGLGIAAWLYQGVTFTSAGLTSISTVLQLTPGIAATGLVWGLVIGFVGGLIPALRAVRQNIVDGLRTGT